NESPRLYIDSLKQNFIVGEQAEVTVSAEDGDSDTVSVILTSDLPEGAAFDNETGKFTMTPENMVPFNLSFIAIDGLGARSPESRITIWICSGCSSNGECNFEVEADEQPVSTGYFVIALCACGVGWEGDNCENDTDGCE
ncbi:unnamed protein product, partial [Owenia fusiformis]